MPEFEFPSINGDMGIHDILNAMAKITKTLDWLNRNMDSLNVTEINTSITRVKSKDGTTTIQGPLIVMKDASGVTRLKMGYDASTNKFVYQMFDESGVETVGITSAGKGKITAGEISGSLITGGTISGASIIGGTLENTGAQTKTRITGGGLDFINQVGGGTLNIPKISMFVEFDGNGNFRFTNNDHENTTMYLTDSKFIVDSDVPIEENINGSKTITAPSGIALQTGSLTWNGQQVATLNGATGTFTTADSKTVIVVNGIVQSIV